MKKLLPILIGFVLLAIPFFTPQTTFAQAAPAPQQLVPAPTTTDSRWVIDPEVTFIGKNARRSGDFLNWTLQNYNWVCVKQLANDQCDNSNNPIAKYWSLIVLYIVVPMLFVVILATSIVIIVTRGKSLTIMRFIPRFVAVILLIVFSYSLLQFFYQFTDLIQGFFLRSNINNACPPACISDKDLLYVGWDYTNFVGLRLLGDKYAESAFISLLLTKLTALTYFVMVFLLLVRKIILWFFIIVSPIFPILLLYYPVRNTGKIWIGEFFRWLLYAPLFAIFLNGLVYLWRNQIPLVFSNPNIGNAAAIEYPTAVNILLGGPRQVVSPTNSVNLVETFALYVVSLIMLWIVILLPWILLQIFLDYAQNFAPGDTAVMKTLVNLATNRPGGGGGGPQQPTEGGAAVSLPFAKKFSVPIDLKPGPTGAAMQLKVDNATVTNANFNQPAFIPSAAINNASVNASVLNAANVKLPSMRDIARFDVALTSRDTSKQQEVNRFSEQLVKIANPIVVTNTVERTQIEKVRERIVQQSQRGNNVASSIMNAANSVSRNNIKASTSDIKNVLSQIANPNSTSTTNSTLVNRDKLAKLHDTLQKQSKESNNQLASSLLSVNEKSSNSEVEKIRDQLKVASMQGNKTASSVVSTINSASQSAQTQNVLKQIANPSSVTNAADRETFTKLHDSLQKESTQGNNQLATSLLSVNEKTSASEIEKISTQLKSAASGGDKTSSSIISTISNATQKSQSEMQTRNVLKQIANPASVTNTAEREMFTRLHDSLQKESSEKSNSLASSILQVSDSTSVTELDKIREQLSQTKENTVIQSVNNLVQQNQSTTHVKSVLQEVANPNTAKIIDQKKVTKLHETLEKESSQGNQLASSILKVNDKTSVDEIEALQQKIQQAQIKGEPLATELSDLAKETTQATLPMVNRVQNVSKEDYQAVKDMWKQNYQNLEVPQGMAGSRSDWIKDDISGIDETIGLLSSQDQDKVQQGMDQVSNLLPFLLVGGFSQTEIIDYLKAKQDAAKEVSTSLAAEEEDKVSVSTRATHATQTMAATMTEESSPSSTSSASVGDKDSGDNDEEESPLTSAGVSSIPAAPQHISTSSTFGMTELTRPKITDIAKFDVNHLTKNKEEAERMEKTREVLKKLANPAQFTQDPDHGKIEELRQKLSEDSQKGDATAASILSAATSTTATQDASQLQQGQALSKEDYEEIKKLWIENYKTLPVPQEFPGDLNGRLEWIKKDGSDIEETVKLLQSSETEKKNEGLKKISGILPFLLLGGYTLQEMTGYLQAKGEAATAATKELEAEEGSKVTVASAGKTEEKADEMTAEEEKK